jgi:hypothetical protein
MFRIIQRVHMIEKFFGRGKSVMPNNDRSAFQGRAARTGKAGSSANAEMRPSWLSVGLNLALLNLAAA